MISFWYSATSSSSSDMATSCAAARALPRHSSAIATIMGIVFTGRGCFGFDAGDRLVMPGDLDDRAGELETEECGLDFMRMGSTFASCFGSAGFA